VASKNTLIHQGGVMQEEEAFIFEQDPLADKYIALRKWDEQTKLVQQPIPDLNKYKQMMLHHLLSQ
jgi:2-amino-1-hydroxyethylphosphonate dioxygenase (glycine-forming)